MTKASTAIEPPTEQSPENVRRIPIMPLRNLVLFPKMMTPLHIARDRSVQLIDRMEEQGSEFGMITQIDGNQVDPNVEDLYEVGCTGKVLNLLRFPDNSLRVLVQGGTRFKVVRYLPSKEFPMAEVELLEETGPEPGPDTDGLIKNIRDQFRRYCAQAPGLPPEMDGAIPDLEDPARIADYVASNLNLETKVLQSLLSISDVRKRLERVSYVLSEELRLQELIGNIHKEVQAAMDRNQREYYLKEQLKIIRKELGEMDVLSEEIEEFRGRIKEARMPAEVEREARRELERMSKIHPEAAEYTVSRTYLDWLVSLPWTKETRDNPNLTRVQKILDQDHFGLEKVKERIVEYLAVRKLKHDTKGPILCFLGPPGVGKTSLGKSIARALGRKFERISLGGIRDEAEIRGHRRTYIGALPGRIIKAIKRAGTRNPVFMLDEIDKVGNDFRGDPASALLEVLDPEQNNTFTDHYLDVPFDLSQVMFIATANMLDPIPSALKDRMEVIDIPGYIEEEKIAIARDYLIPRQYKEHGLTRRNLRITEDAITEVVRHYTREAGVRGLERKIARICRKVAKQVALHESKKHTITRDNLENYLGPVEFLPDLAERVDIPGVAIGLAWTPSGGDILFIEASRMKGKKTFKITGQLGDIMRESAEAALTYLRANADALNIDPDAFEVSDLHVHVPAGSIPKDGPSAGVTLLTALTSLMSGRPVRSDIAMTGEITLRGKVLPVGGIKEKVLAARRVGIQNVILPTRNKKDLVDIPSPLMEGMHFYFVDNVEEVLELALTPGADENSRIGPALPYEEDKNTETTGPMGSGGGQGRRSPALKPGARP